MNAFHVAVAILITAALVAVVVLWIRRRRAAGSAALEVDEAGTGVQVPPFRISLEPVQGHRWMAAEAVASATEALVACGYVPVTDYAIREMTGVHVRGFVHDGASTLAALYEQPGNGFLLDLTRLHTDRAQILVSSAPHTGLQDPPGKVVHHAPLDASSSKASLMQAIAGMHEKLLSMSRQRTPLAVTSRLFATIFTTAYAAEMDWRIRQGGVSASEMRAAARAVGQEPPGDDAADKVQRSWRDAIARQAGRGSR